MTVEPKRVMTQYLDDKGVNVPTTEAERTTKNGRANGAAEGIAEGIAESFEGLATIARTQAEDSFKQGEKAGLVLRDQSIVSIKAAEAIGLSLLSAVADITAPLMPRLPSVVPASNLDTWVKAGFDITQQVVSSERRLVEAAVGIVVRQAA
jgi:hypothetical protein